MSLFWPVVINHTGLMSVSKSLPFVKSVGQKPRLQLKNRHRPAITACHEASKCANGQVYNTVFTDTVLYTVQFILYFQN